MSSWLHTACLRERAYAGDLQHFPPHPATRALCRFAWERVQAVCPEPLLAHNQPLTGFLDDLSRARRALHHPRARAHVRGLLRALGTQPDDWHIDTLRLRAVPPGGPTSHAAEAAWAVHRDTWYANPAAQLNLWLPLVPVTAATSVQVYPSAFRAHVANNSADFDYTQFSRLAGWQARGPNTATYPAATSLQGHAPMGICAAPASLLVFSAQQLHGSPRHEAHHTRWSLDVRVVHRADNAAGRGPLCEDNRSTGSALEHYPW